MLSPRYTEIKQSIFTEVFGNRGLTYFWHARFLPRWLPLLLGLVLGVGSAILIVGGSLYYAIALVLAAPTIILLVSRPYMSVVLWILIAPFFETGFVFWIVHRAMLPGMIGLIVLLKWVGIKKQNKLVKLGVPDFAMLGFLAFGIVSIILLSQEPRANFRFIDRLFVPFCLYWLTRLTIQTREDLKQIIWATFFITIFQCILGLASAFAPGVLPSRWQSTYTDGIRLEGTFGNVAVYTSTIVVFGSLLLHYRPDYSSKWLRRAIVFVFGLVGLSLFFSFSRGSWLGGAVVLIGLLILYPKVISRLIIVLTILVVLLSGSLLASHVAWGYERLYGQRSQQTADGRMIANYTSLRMIEAKPFFGWGFENRGFYSLQFTRTRVGDITGSRHVSSHNTYLTMATELGLVGVLFYLFPAVWWLFITIRKWRTLPETGFWSRRLLVGLWLAMAHMFIVSNFMDMTIHYFGMALWWFVLALIANVLSLPSGTRHPQTVKAVKPSTWAYRS